MTTQDTRMMSKERELTMVSFSGGQKGRCLDLTTKTGERLTFTKEQAAQLLSGVAEWMAEGHLTEVD